MKAEHLKARLQAETREKYPGTEAWDKAVSVIQTHRGRGDSGGGKENPVRQGGRTIGDEG